MKFGKWYSTWADFTRQMPVTFELVLEDPSTSADCLIGQDKKGEVDAKGLSKDSFPSWTADGPIGQRFWWDGSQWPAGKGSWNWDDDEATFHDKPGFYKLGDKNFPAYYGGVGRKGYFEFRTYVADISSKASVTPLRTLTWGILIDYSDPKTGVNYFYK